MKHRSLLSNICSVIIILALILVLLAYFGVIGGGRDSDAAKTVINIALPVAIVAVAFFDIVFPVLDNRKKLKEGKYILKVVLKTILFAGSMVVIALTLNGKLDEIPALVVFVVLYFAQFFIYLDNREGKKSKKNKEENPEVKNAEVNVIPEENNGETFDFGDEEDEEEDSSEENR